MTKPKLRKKAEINPPQSPHDGIHTCSKGCKKPGCTRTLRDTIEEQDKQIEALKRDLLEKTAELRNLKEVVHDLRISAEDDLDTIDTARKEIARLQAECKELKYERIHDINQMGGLQEENAILKEKMESYIEEAHTLGCFMRRFDWIIYSHNCKGGVERTHKALDELRANYLEWRNPGEEQGL